MMSLLQHSITEMLSIVRYVIMMSLLLFVDPRAGTGERTSLFLYRNGSCTSRGFETKTTPSHRRYIHIYTHTTHTITSHSHPHTIGGASEELDESNASEWLSP